MHTLPFELIGEIASFLHNGTVNLFATCKSISEVQRDKRAYARFLARRNAETALNDLSQAISRCAWQEDDVLTALRILFELLPHTACCNMLAVKSASMGFTRVLQALPRQTDEGAARTLAAAGASGAVSTLQYLLDQGSSPLAMSSFPLLETASAGQAAALDMMLQCIGSCLPGALEEAALSAALLHDACLVSMLGVVYEGPSAAKDVALLEAARRGKKSAVLLLIEARADVHAMQDEALCEAQDPEVIKALLEAGADVHAQQEFPLLAACTHGHDDIAELLLQHGADLHAKDDAALVRASCEGHPSTVTLLLGQGARPNAQQGLPLIRAAAKGFRDIVCSLIDAGADVHAQYGSAIVAAAMGGHEGVVCELLDAGADVNAEDSGALCAAVSKQHCSLVQLLLSRGADVHMVEEDLEALAHATEANDVETLRLLLGAGLDILNCGSSSALLMAAVRAGAREAGVLLLSAGACFSETEALDHPERVEAVDQLVGGNQLAV